MTEGGPERGGVPSFRKRFAGTHRGRDRRDWQRQRTVPCRRSRRAESLTIEELVRVPAADGDGCERSDDSKGATSLASLSSRCASADGSMPSRSARSASRRAASSSSSTTKRVTLTSLRRAALVPSRQQGTRRRAAPSRLRALYSSGEVVASSFPLGVGSTRWWVWTSRDRASGGMSCCESRSRCSCR